MLDGHTGRGWPSHLIGFPVGDHLLLEDHDEYALATATQVSCASVSVGRLGSHTGNDENDRMLMNVTGSAVHLYRGRKFLQGIKGAGTGRISNVWAGVLLRGGGPNMVCFHWFQNV